MNIDSQVAALKAAQGALPVEQRMLGEAFVGPPAPTSTPGMNTTKRLALVGGDVVFHKPFSGVQVANAIAFGQTGETPPLHEAASWRLAVVLGPPWEEIVAPCVLREYAGEDGSLSLRASGWPRDAAPTLAPTWCLPAAFFDSLIAQQDRHADNWRWDGSHLTLIDHGYTFALPGAILNYLRLRGCAPWARCRGFAHGGARRAHPPAQQLRPARDGEVPPVRPCAGAGGQGASHARKRRDSAPGRVLRMPLSENATLCLTFRTT